MLSSFVVTCFNWLLSKVFTSALESTASSSISEKHHQIAFSKTSNIALSLRNIPNLFSPWKVHSKLIHLPCLLGSTTFSVVGTWCNLFWSNSRTSERSGRFDGGGILSAVRSESKNVLSYQLLPFNHSNVSSLTTNKHFQFFPISRGNEKFEESCERWSFVSHESYARINSIHRTHRFSALNKTLHAQRAWTCSKRQAPVEIP